MKSMEHIAQFKNAERTYFKTALQCDNCPIAIAFENQNAYNQFIDGHIHCPQCRGPAFHDIDVNDSLGMHIYYRDLNKIDNVNHPKHYTSHPSGVECITITRHMLFNVGNAIKYLWRADEKGNDIQDLEKAMWYIKDEIQRRIDLKNGMYAQKKNNAHE